MQMKDIAELVGEEVAVEFPVAEAGQGYGSSRGVVRAAVVEAPHEFSQTEYGGRAKRLKGARLRLAAPFRRLSGDEGGFAELPAGHEFNAESRQILRAWAGSDPFRSGGSLHASTDDECEALRARRYAEQDVVRERLVALGLEEATRGVGASRGMFRLRGDDVTIDRGTLAKVLVRADPVRVAGDAIEEYASGVDAGEWAPADARPLVAQRHERVKAAVLVEVEQGLAVSDSDIEVEPAPEDQYAQDFDERTDRAMRSGGAGPV